MGIVSMVIHWTHQCPRRSHFGLRIPATGLPSQLLASSGFAVRVMACDSPLASISWAARRGISLYIGCIRHRMHHSHPALQHYFYRSYLQSTANKRRCRGMLAFQAAAQEHHFKHRHIGSSVFSAGCPQQFEHPMGSHHEALPDQVLSYTEL